MSYISRVQVLLFTVLLSLPASNAYGFISKVKHVIGFEFVRVNHLAIAVEHNKVVGVFVVLSNPVVTTGTLNSAFIPLLIVKERLSNGRIMVYIIGNLEHEVNSVFGDLF